MKHYLQWTGIIMVAAGFVLSSGWLDTILPSGPGPGIIILTSIVFLVVGGLALAAVAGFMRGPE